MPQQTTTPLLDQETADRLSAAFHRCFSDLEAADDLFTADAFYDLLPPMWRFQLEGSGEVFTDQLRAISEGPAEIEVLRTVPTATGFVTEHIETQQTPHGEVVARRLHLCEVSEGRICAVVTYCNGGWDAELRDRHAADAPMLAGRA
jgi:hypothetical protein